MEITFVTAFWQSLTTPTSRRGLLAGLNGGLLATGLIGFGVDESEARKNGKRNKKRNRKNAKNKKSQTSVAASCSGSSFRINTGGERRLAQAFVAQTSGPLVKVELELDQSSTDGIGDYILRLTPVDDESVPTNQVLAESVVAGSSVPDGPSIATFAFADPFPLKAGIEYSLVLSRPESVQFAWAGDLGDRCGSHLFFSPDQTGVFFPFDPAVEGRFTAFVKS